MKGNIGSTYVPSNLGELPSSQKISQKSVYIWLCSDSSLCQLSVYAIIQKLMTKTRQMCLTDVKQENVMGEWCRRSRITMKQSSIIEKINQFKTVLNIFCRDHLSYSFLFFTTAFHHFAYFPGTSLKGQFTSIKNTYFYPPTCCDILYQK